MVVSNNSKRRGAATTRRPAAGKKTAVPAVVEAEPAGFQRRPKLYTLDFIGEWAGMNVSFRPMRYGDMLDGGVTLDWMAQETPRDEWLAGMEALCDAAASVLHEWNVLDHHGDPVPATLDGLRSLDQDQAIAIVMSWAVRVLGVSGPLDGPSGSGATSEAPLIPMETPSPSPES